MSGSGTRARRARRIAALFAVAALPAQDPPAPESIDLKLQTRAGARAKFVVEDRTQQHSRMPDQQVEGGYTVRAEIEVEVLRVGDDGRVTAKAEWLAIRGSLTQPGTTVEFDSTRPDEPAAAPAADPRAEPIRAMFTALAGAQLEFTVDAKGRVVEVADLDAALQRIVAKLPAAIRDGAARSESLSPAVIRQQLAFFGPLPERPMPVGGSWQTDERMSAFLAMPATHRLAACDDDRIRLELEADRVVTPAELPAELRAAKFEQPKLTGRIEILRSDGMLHRAERGFSLQMLLPNPLGEGEPVRMQISRQLRVTRAEPVAPGAKR